MKKVQCAQYPFSYGDENSQKTFLSEQILELVKNKKILKSGKIMFFVLIILGIYAYPALAIPFEYGKIAVETTRPVKYLIPPLGKIESTIEIDLIPVLEPIREYNYSQLMSKISKFGGFIDFVSKFL